MKLNPAPPLMLMNDLCLFSLPRGSDLLGSPRRPERVSLLIRIGAQSVVSDNKPRDKTEQSLRSLGFPFVARGRSL